VATLTGALLLDGTATGGGDLNGLGRSSGLLLFDGPDEVRGEQVRQDGDRLLFVGPVEVDVAGVPKGQVRRPARPAARRDGGVLAAGTMGLVVRGHGLCPVPPETSALGVDIDDSIAARSQGLKRRFLPFFLSAVAAAP
jgi:hypothetical protein